jgi:hypothetical protein
MGRAAPDRVRLASLLFCRLWWLGFSTKLVGHKLTSGFVLVPPKASPASRALVRGFVQRRPTLRTSDTRVDEWAGKQADRAKKKAKGKTSQRVVSLAGNQCACDYGGNPRPYEIAFHHAHPFSTHISSRIGPATMQARKSRAIRRDVFMVNRIDADGRNVK